MTKYTDMSTKELVSLHSYHIDMMNELFDLIIERLEVDPMADKEYAAAKAEELAMRWNPQ